MKFKCLLIMFFMINFLFSFYAKVKIEIQNRTNDTLKEPMLYNIKGKKYLIKNIEKIYFNTIPPNGKVSQILYLEIKKFDVEIAFKILVKNGEVYPEIIKNISKVS